MTDLALAIVHHLLVFGLAAVLAAELALMRPAAISPQTVRLLGRFDAAYVPPLAEIGRLRRLLLIEIHVFALIPMFAAAMARGVGHTAG